jgi:hypothetical protein
VVLKRFTGAIEAYDGGLIRFAKEDILKISELAQSLPPEDTEANDGSQFP